ncbi:Protein ECERIFERUM 2, partial [Bienertia sinuspersici]
ELSPWSNWSKVVLAPAPVPVIGLSLSKPQTTAPQKYIVPKIEEEILVFDKRLSSVVPGKITGENKTYELKGIDLAMKLHYIKGLYFFTNTLTSGSEGENATSSFINIQEIKKPMFDWLISYFKASGRIRLSSLETGDRPSIKLNDAGIRIVEARSSKSIDEWLTMENFPAFNHQLVYHNVLGPDLAFSPLICIQVTWFKCGGISMGLSWAHVLGDGLSASEFMNMLGQYIQGHLQKPETLVHVDHPQSNYPPSDPAQEPITVKRVNPVDNHWALPTNCKIGTHIFHLTSQQLSKLHSAVHNSERNEISTTIQSFEVITAIIWKSIAK